MVPPYAFESALVMQHVTLPPRLEVIGDFAFRRCIALRSIDMPERALHWRRSV